MTRRRGKTLRLGPAGTWRIAMPSERCRFGQSGHSMSLGWLLIRKVG